MFIGLGAFCPITLKRKNLVFNGLPIAKFPEIFVTFYRTDLMSARFWVILGCYAPVSDFARFVPCAGGNDFWRENCRRYVSFWFLVSKVRVRAMLYKRRAGGRLIHFFTHKTAYHVAELTVARRRTDPADSIGRVCTRNRDTRRTA